MNKLPFKAYHLSRYPVIFVYRIVVSEAHVHGQRKGVEISYCMHQTIGHISRIHKLSPCSSTAPYPHLFPVRYYSIVDFFYDSGNQMRVTWVKLIPSAVKITGD